MTKECENFNNVRLAVARKRHGLTKTALARDLGLSVRSIALYESGDQFPSQATLDMISQRLGFPLEFFFGDDLEEIEADSVSFRALSKMSAAQRDMALTAGSLALLFNAWLEENFSLPEPQLPDLSQESDPETAADVLRRDWGFGEAPVQNMVHLLESKGVRVFSAVVETTNVDAYSMWKNERPFIFLNTLKSAERSRFDAAHELAHLVLHRHALERTKSAEHEANQFASSFLMPRASVRSRALGLRKLEQLVQAKKYWNVAVSALAYRLRDVGLLTDWQYRSLAIEITKSGYRIEEPNPSSRESSQVFTKIVRLLHAEGQSILDVASSLGLPEAELNDLLFGLALVKVGGKGATSSSRHEPPKLELVKN